MSAFVSVESLVTTMRKQRDANGTPLNTSQTINFPRLAWGQPGLTEAEIRAEFAKQEAHDD